MKCYIHNDIDAIGTCVECGKPVCESCNTEVNDKYYCKKCIEKKFNASENKDVVIINRINNTSDTRVRVSKSKVAAGILAILIGGVGAHKFYLGKIGLGIFYLLFCWTYIPAIVGLIEGIIYLCTDDKKFSDKYDILR